MHRRLTNSAEAFNPNWTVGTNSICVVGGAERRPDVGVWFIRPTFAQRSRPIIDQCPPPNVYIEVIVLISTEENRKIKWFDLSDLNPLVFFNKDPDTIILYVTQPWSKKSHLL
jgi:hypothetical protein